MISRIWHGWTNPQNADNYEALLKEEIFVGIHERHIRGFKGIQLLRRAINVYHVEYYIPYGGRIYAILTDRPNDNVVQSILMTIRFIALPQPVTYDVRMADNGKTFVMNIGDKLRLNLDYGYGWSATSISDPAIVVGAQDGYIAFTNGTATLTVTGDPVCLSSTPPCRRPSIVFEIMVIVQ